jgi:Ca2+-binding EF-hand superfamily protein
MKAERRRAEPRTGIMSLSVDTTPSEFLSSRLGLSQPRRRGGSGAGRPGLHGSSSLGSRVFTAPGLLSAGALSGSLAAGGTDGGDFTALHSSPSTQLEQWSSLTPPLPLLAASGFEASVPLSGHAASRRGVGIGFALEGDSDEDGLPHALPRPRGASLPRLRSRRDGGDAARAATAPVPERGPPVGAAVAAAGALQRRPPAGAPSPPSLAAGALALSAAEASEIGRASIAALSQTQSKPVVQRAIRKMSAALRPEVAPVAAGRITPLEKRSREALARHEMPQSEEARRVAAAAAAAVGEPEAPPTMFGYYSAGDVTELKTLFDEFDVDGSGEIDAREFTTSQTWKASAFGSIGGSVFESIDADGSGTIDLLELMRVVFPRASAKELRDMCKFARTAHVVDAQKVVEPLAPEKLEDLRAIFRILDVHGSGSLEIDALWRMLDVKMGGIVSRADLVRMCTERGILVDKPLSLEDFITLLRDTI